MKYKQRGLRNGEVSKNKKQAMKDISSECGDNKPYSQNYINKEYIVLKSLEYNYEYLFI